MDKLYPAEIYLMINYYTMNVEESNKSSNKQMLNKNSGNIDTEWKWIKKNFGNYDMNTIKNFLSTERVRVTFSNRLDDSFEISSNENNQTNYYKEQVSEQTSNRKDSEYRRDKPEIQNPEKENDNS